MKTQQNSTANSLIHSSNISCATIAVKLENKSE